MFAGRSPAEWLQARADRFRPSSGGLQLGLEVSSSSPLLLLFLLFLLLFLLLLLSL